MGYVWRALNRIRSDESGQSIVEFALMLPLFVYIFGAVFQYGLILHYKVAIAGAAREGARWGSVMPLDDSLITQTARDASYGYMENAINTRVASSSTYEAVLLDGATTNGLLVVKVKSEVPVYFNLPGALVGAQGGGIFSGSSYTVSSASVMRLESTVIP